jgi:hypothetical protein
MQHLFSQTPFLRFILIASLYLLLGLSGNPFPKVLFTMMNLIIIVGHENKSSL